jgi:hypothetical protein
LHLAGAQVVKEKRFRQQNLWVDSSGSGSRPKL